MVDVHGFILAPTHRVIARVLAGAVAATLPPQQFHFDIKVDEIEAAERAVLSILPEAARLIQSALWVRIRAFNVVEQSQSGHDETDRSLRTLKKHARF